jgi:DNA-binding NtrC family response regulator
MAGAAKTETILFVGIAACDGLSLNEILRDSTWQWHGAGTCREALEFLEQHRVPVVLSEPDLPDGTWRELLNSMASLFAPPNLVVSSRLADHRLWSEVLNLGGFDVLMTPFEAEEVLRVTGSAHRNWGRLQVEGRARAARSGQSRTSDGHGGTAGFPAFQ